MPVFDNYSFYYDILYKDKNYEKEIEYIDSIIRKFSNDSNTILDLGCGTGKHVSFLAKKNYIVEGVDVSKKMINIAQNNYPDCKFYHHDIRTFNKTKVFDIVTSLFHVISYQTSYSDLDQTFNTAAKHLKSKGLFIFDFWYGPAVLTDKPSIRIRRFENDLYKITRISEPTIDFNSSIVNVNFEIIIENKIKKEIETLHETHKMRYLFLPEIEYFLKKNNFRVINRVKWLSHNEGLSEKSWYGLIVGEKV